MAVCAGDIVGKVDGMSIAGVDVLMVKCCAVGMPAEGAATAGDTGCVDVVSVWVCQCVSVGVVDIWVSECGG